MSSSAPQQSIAILGTGIIGLSSAYYLSLHQQHSSSSSPPPKIHLIDPNPATSLFTSASGFAAGYLARDWFPAAVAPLGQLSFDLHAQLAAEHGGREAWGWTGSTSLSFVEEEEEGGQGKGRERERPEDWLRAGVSRAGAAAGEGFHRTGRAPEWLRRAAGKDVRVLGDERTTGQVDPLRLCNWLLTRCLAQGVTLHAGHKATSVQRNASTGAVEGVRITSTTSTTSTVIPCTHLLLTAGAWTPDLYRTLFPASPLRIPITPVSGHSILMRSAAWEEKEKEEGEASGTTTTTTHAVFATDPSGTFFPEMFSRVDGTIYLAGLNSGTIPLPPAEQGKATPDPSQIARLKETACALYGLPFSSSSPEDAGEKGGKTKKEKQSITLLRQGLCFRPAGPAGRPVVGRVPDELLGPTAKPKAELGRQGAAEPKPDAEAAPGAQAQAPAQGGVFIAAGHGPWGISLALGTGKVVAEMMTRGRVESVEVGALGVRETCEVEGRGRARL